MTGVGVEERLDGMKKRLQWLLDWLCHPNRQGSREHFAEINREVVDSLRTCQALDCAPPDELIRLVAQQLYVKGKPRSDSKDPGKKIKAADFIAANPAASDRKVARLAGVSHHSIKNWRKDSGFQQNILGSKQFMSIYHKKKVEKGLK